MSAHWGDAEGPDRTPQSNLEMTTAVSAGGKLRFLLYQSGPAAVAVTSVLVWPLLGHLMSKSLLGTLSSVLATASIISPAMCIGLHLYLANRLAKNNGYRAGIEGRVGSIATFLLYALAVIASALSIFLPGEIWLIGAVSSASAAFLLTSGTIRGLDRPYFFSAFTLFVQVGGLSLLGFVASYAEALAPGVICYVAVIGVGVVGQYFFLWKPSESASWEGGLRLIVAAARLVPHAVLAVALLMMMRILVGLESGPASLASYHYASLVVGGLTTVAASLDAHWSVRAQAAGSRLTLQGMLERNQLRIQLSMLVGTGGAIAFCALALPIWLPSGYDPDPIVACVALALPAGALQAYADGQSALAMWMNRNGIVSASTVVGVLVAIVVAVTCIPTLGWPIVGLAITLGSLMRAIFMVLGTWSIAGTFLFSWRPTLLVCLQLSAPILLWLVIDRGVA